MEKKLFFIFAIFLILAFYKCEENAEKESENELFDDDFDQEESFKKSLKEYLVKSNLFDSDRLIEKEEMKKIFLDVILERDPEYAPEYLKESIEYLSKYFVGKYYKKHKEIRGKDIYNLIDIVAISTKFQQLIGEYDDYEEEEEMVKSPDL